jgi:hypothetical protein
MENGSSTQILPHSVAPEANNIVIVSGIELCQTKLTKKKKKKSAHLQND